jgi:hypothetical protein
MFSKWPELVFAKFIIKLAALHPGATPLVSGGHSAGVNLVLEASPTRA